MKNKWIIGTRPSKLARFQTGFVKSLLLARDPHLDIQVRVIKTAGDRRKKITRWGEAGVKGLFTKELGEALVLGEVDFAVHSMKDLPSVSQPGLRIAAVPVREEVQDILVSKEHVLFDHLPKGARVGTASLRRKTQLQRLREDLDIVGVRGNVPTRIRKALEGPFDAVILAKAGCRRLGLEEFITEEFSIEQMLPAVGQGALAIETRENDEDALKLLSLINDDDLFCATSAERAMLQRLGGDCHVPIAGYAVVEGNQIVLEGGVFSLSPENMVREIVEGPKHAPAVLGIKLAERLIKGGAMDILEKLKMDHLP